MQLVCSIGFWVGQLHHVGYPLEQNSGLVKELLQESEPVAARKRVARDDRTNLVLLPRKPESQVKYTNIVLGISLDGLLDVIKVLVVISRARRATVVVIIPSGNEDLHRRFHFFDLYLIYPLV